MKIKEEKSTTKKIKPVIYNILIILCLALMAFSVYKIINWLIENNKNKSIVSEVQSMVTVTQEEIIVDNRPIVKPSYDFTQLLKNNSETVGWVNVPNSKINYPVVQTTDNDFYLTHSFNKAPNSAGWVFMDCNCDVSSSQNLIVYGHNRKDYSMFGSLKLILDDNWRSNTDNLYINFSDLNETGIYKVFSTVICNDADVKSYLKTNFASQESFKEYIEKLQKNSMYKFDTNIENAEKMITLYTCYGQNNKRLLVYAVKVF